MIPWKRNFLAKALALVGAIVLWAFVMSEQNPMVEVEYHVPVHLVNTQTTQIVKNAPKDIVVTLRGPRNIILHLDQHTLVATINMSEVGFGEESLPIHFEPPNGLSLIKQEPGIANLFIDSYAVKELPLEVNPVGEQPYGFGVKEANIVPKYVTVTGAKGNIDKIAKAIVNVKMDNRRDDFKEEGVVSLVDKDGNNIDDVSVAPKVANVEVIVDKDVFDKRVPVVVGFRGEVAEGYKLGKVQIKPGTITIVGKQNQVKDIDKVTVDLIDISGATDTIKTKGEILLPEGIKSDTKEVEIVIQVVPNDK